jgi:hypothetical protein
MAEVIEGCGEPGHLRQSAALQILEREEFDLIGAPLPLWEAFTRGPLSLLFRLTSASGQETLTPDLREKTLNLHFLPNLFENGSCRPASPPGCLSSPRRSKSLHLNEVGGLNSTLDLQTIRIWSWEGEGDDEGGS